MRVTAALPSGVSALFFGTARRRRVLEARLEELLEGCGYSEVILPILDYLEPYEPLLSARDRGELYRFIDRDGEQLALRADFTPMLARLLAPRLASMELPLRLSYRGDVVRYQEERPGRQRESHQLGAELLGVEGAAAEREVLELFLSMLGSCQLAGVQVVLGHSGSLDSLAVSCAGEGGAAELLARVGRRERGALAGHEGPAARALREVIEDGWPSEPASLGAARPAVEGLEALRDELAPRFPELRLSLDLAEFADLSRSYYDGLLFRAYCAGGAQPLGGGGRYDTLFRSLGAEVAAAGFSLSMDRLLTEAGRGGEGGLCGGLP